MVVILKVSYASSGQPTLLPQPPLASTDSARALKDAVMRVCFT
jgi:hypothetical protein